MNESESESKFEAELRALRPVPPSEAVEAAIARELRHEPPAARQRSGAIPRSRGESRFGRILWSLGCAAAGAAVALLVTQVLDRPGRSTRSTAPVAQAAFVPTESSHELLGTEDGGLLYRDGQAPAQVLRYSSLERHAWANPTTGARVEVEVPREDVVLLPVSYQ